MKRSVSSALSFKLLIESNPCLSATDKFILEETKLIRKGELSIFLIAKVASVGIFGLSLIISIAKSLIDSTIV